MEKFVTRAARLNKAYDIELIERELECGEDDIIVRNHMMGICGSDKSFYRGSMPPQTAEFRQPPEFPFLLGHESGGTVVAVGDRVSDYKVGDKVMAFGWNNNFADYFKSKAFQLQPVPEGLDMDIAALGEPTACAMYSGLNTGVQLGDTVVIMGGGYAGQIIAQCSKLKGAYQVIVVDVLEGKLDLAKSLGADVVIPTMEEKVTYKIPAGTQPGTTFRLKGKGVKSPTVSSIVGDLYVKVLLEVPTKLSAEQRRLLKEFDEGMDTDAYVRKKSFAETVKELFTGESRGKAPSDKKKKKKK